MIENFFFITFYLDWDGGPNDFKWRNGNFQLKRVSPNPTGSNKLTRLQDRSQLKSEEFESMEPLRERDSAGWSGNHINSFAVLPVEKIAKKDISRWESINHFRFITFIFLFRREIIKFLGDYKWYCIIFRRIQRGKKD